MAIQNPRYPHDALRQRKPTIGDNKDSPFNGGFNAVKTNRKYHVWDAGKRRVEMTRLSQNIS